MKRIDRRLLVAMVLALPLLAAGCAEEAQVTVYQQGKYKGKPDSQPWANQQFQDKTAWEKAVTDRTRSQNEYVRIEHGV